MFDRWPLIKSLCACIIGAGTPAFFLLLISILSVLIDGIGKPEKLGSILTIFSSRSDFFAFTYFFVCTLLPMIFIGLPVQALLQKCRQTGYWVHAICSVVGGALASLFLFPSLPLAGFCAAIGFTAGSVAWLIRRPDKDVPKVLP